MEQEQIDKIHAQIADLRQKLNTVVGGHATALGFPETDTRALLNVVQPEFLQAWFDGTPADVALINAIQKADLAICTTMMEREVSQGRSPEEVFADIKAMKARAGGSSDDEASAEAAFAAAISEGASPAAAVEAAFQAVA